MKGAGYSRTAKGLLGTRVRRSFNTYFSLVMSSASAGTVSMGPLWDYDLGFANVRKVRRTFVHPSGVLTVLTGCSRHPLLLRLFDLGGAGTPSVPAHAGAQSPLGRARAYGH